MLNLITNKNINNLFEIAYKGNSNAINHIALKINKENFEIQIKKL